MKIGKMYFSKKYIWLLFPSKEKVFFQISEFEDRAAIYSNYWSKQLNCSVPYISLNSIFVVLEKEAIDNLHQRIKILTNNGAIGWIIVDDYTKGYLEEVKDEQHHGSR